MGDNLKDVAFIIAQDVRRNGNEGKGYSLNNENWTLFNRILDIFDSVSIKRETRQKKPQNPIYHLLKLADSQTENSNPALTVNKSKLQNVLTEIAESLSKQQKTFDAQIDSLKEIHNQSYSKLETEYASAKKQISDYQTQRKSIAEQCQYLLTKFVNDKDLVRILKIMGMTAVFPEEIDDEKISQYFTILKTDLPDNACISPCIMFGDEIFIHGEIIKYEEKS